MRKILIFLKIRTGGEETVFVEELTKIKESENYADELQRKAKADSKQALAEARTKADKIATDAENRAKDIYDSLMKEGQAKSDEQYRLFLEKTKNECEAMIEKARNNENKAIEFIAERIVRSSVNN